MSSIQSNYQVSGVLQSTVGGAGTTAKYFPMPLGPSIGVEPSTPSATNATGQLPYLGSNKLNGQTVDLDIVGWISSDPTIACPSVTIELVANTGTLTTPTYTVIASTGSNAAGTTDFDSFAIHGKVQGDSTTGQFYGVYSALWNGALVNATPKVTTVLTGINYVTEPPFGLVVRVTFSVSGAANKAFLSQFSLAS